MLIRHRQKHTRTSRAVPLPTGTIAYGCKVAAVGALSNADMCQTNNPAIHQKPTQRDRDFLAWIYVNQEAGTQMDFQQPNNRILARTWTSTAVSILLYILLRVFYFRVWVTTTQQQYCCTLYSYVRSTAVSIETRLYFLFSVKYCEFWVCRVLFGLRRRLLSHARSC